MFYQSFLMSIYIAKIEYEYKLECPSALNVPKLSFSQISPISVQTRKAWNNGSSILRARNPARGGCSRKSVQTRAIGLGTSITLSCRES
jgi:hypothetical protein